MSRPRFSTVTLFALLFTIQANAALAQFQSVVRHLPHDANVLLLFNVEKILASPLAKQQGWLEKGENAYAAGLTYLPPQANHFAMAAQLDIELMHTRWRAAVMDLKYEPSMPKLAAQHRGTVDEIENRNVAALPPDTYVVKFMKNMMGVMSPADRQHVARWIKDVYSGSLKSPMSDYLQAAEAYADRGAPIIMAIDLQHLMSAKEIRDHLDNLASLKGKQVDLDQLSKMFASIRGVTLGITISDHVHGAIKVDFDQDVTLMKDFAKPVLLEALANRGAMIDEFKTWQLQLSGKTIKLEGNLFQSGMQRIMSLLDTPPSLHVEQPKSAAGQQATEQSLVLLATQQHFKSVTHLLDDLHKSDRSARSMGQIGMWFNKYASKIDALPILNVDKDLVKFSASVAYQLRQAHQAIASAGERSAVRQADAPNVSAYAYSARAGVVGAGWGGVYGGYAYQARYLPNQSRALRGQELARIRTEERVRGGSQANNILENVAQETAEVRRQMTERYKVEF